MLRTRVSYSLVYDEAIVSIGITYIKTCMLETNNKHLFIYFKSNHRYSDVFWIEMFIYLGFVRFFFVFFYSEGVSGVSAV